MKGIDAPAVSVAALRELTNACTVCGQAPDVDEDPPPDGLIVGVPDVVVDVVDDEAAQDATGSDVSRASKKVSNMVRR